MTDGSDVISSLRRSAHIYSTSRDPPIPPSMATVAAVVPHSRSIRLRPTIFVAALCLASAVLYAWMRAGVAVDLHAPFARWCSDVMEPGDWPCRVSASDFLWSYTGGSILIWLALAIPGVVLAASGRRASSLGPVSLAAAGALVVSVVALPSGSTQPFGIADTFFASGEVGRFWGIHTALAILVDLILVSIPAIAVAFVLRPRRRPPAPILPRHAVWASTLTIGATIVAIRIAWPNLPHEEFFSGPLDDIGLSMAVIVLFGAMLGTDRRWWPWALVPAAVLLSLGPATALMSIPSNLTTFMWFADALPLAVVGLVASLWRPLATRFAGRRAPISPPVEATPAARPRSLLLDVSAAGLLVVSILAAGLDPLGIEIATSLPTYLGPRVQAQDVRAKMNLTQALSAMESYRAEQGTFRGFDAAAGETLAPGLAWSDTPTGDRLVVRIARMTATIAQVVTVSGSGSAFCAEMTRAGLTYGVAQRVVLARAACGSEPLDAAALRMIDVDTFCDNADDTAIVLCRYVQRLLRETLASPIAA